MNSQKKINFSKSINGVSAIESTININTLNLSVASPIIADITEFQVPPLIKSFRGREEEMNRLETLLFTENNKKVVISGHAGMGKTETAKQFAIKCLNNGHVDKIFWINAERMEDIQSSFNKLGENINLPKADEYTKVKHVHHYFENYRCLYIFDNAISRKQILKYEPLDDQYILVTSQDKNWGTEFKVIELFSLTTDGALQVIQTILAKHYMKQHVEQYERLAEIVYNVPLGLQVIAGYLYDFMSQEIPVAIEKYITEINRTIIDRKINSSLPNEYENSIYEAVNLTLEKMYKSDYGTPKIRERAFIILSCCSFLNIDHIHLDDIKDIIQFEDNSEKYNLGSILNFLNKFSILNRSGDKLQLPMHQMTQRILRLYFREKHIDIQTQSYTLCLNYAIQDNVLNYHRNDIISYADENLDTFINFYKVYLDKKKSNRFKYRMYKLLKSKTQNFKKEFDLHKNITHCLLRSECMKTLKYLRDLTDI